MTNYSLDSHPCKAYKRFETQAIASSNDVAIPIEETQAIKLSPSHLEELRASGIADDVINANFESIEGQWAVDLMLPYKQWQRRNDGRLTDSDLRIYNVFADGGWTCSGLNPITLEGSQWGCFKPDRPRVSKDGKVIKYEHPHKVSTEAFCLRPTRHIWRKVGKRSGVECPDLKAIPNEELSKAFWQWVKDNPTVPILITEGAKKAASLLSAGYVAIGLPGIYSGYRTPKDEYGNRTSELSYLIPELATFCQKGHEIVFCFDNDNKPTTQDNVRKAITNTGRLIEQQGCQVSVMTWHGTAKGIDDVIAANGEGTLDHIYATRQPLEAYRLTEYTDLAPLVSQTVYSRYLGDDLAIPDNVRLIGTLSPRGTGKTEWLAKIIREAGDRPVIVISHREQLCKELSLRFGLEYRTELTQEGRWLGYILCVDSLHPKANPPFHPENWENCLVVIDEAEQVIWHLLNSSTCQRNRPAIVETLAALLNGAHQIFLSDADLTSVSVDYINGLLKTPTTPWIVVNEYSPAAARQCFVYPTPGALFGELLNFIQKGDRIMIHTGGQKVSSKWGSINLESYLRKAFSHLKILRIDAESVADPNHPAYGVMGNLNAVIALYDIVIASPTLETGVSIDIKGHFNRVFCFAQGSQTPEAVCQSLARVREDVPRYLWIRNYSGRRIGNGSTIPSLLIKSQQKVFKANFNLLGQADTVANLDGNSPCHMATWAKYSAMHNYGFKNYAKVVFARLKTEGYEFIAAGDPVSGKMFKEIMEEHTKEKYQVYCEKVATAPLLDNQEFDRISNARAKTEQERLSERKTAISKRYLTKDVTPDLVAQDDDGLYGQLRLRYYLTIGRDFLADRDLNRVMQLMEQTGSAFTPDINNACYSAQVRALEVINIGQFLDGSTYTSKSLQDWFEILGLFRHAIKDLLNQSINPEKDTPIGVAQRLLGLMRLKMTKKQCRINGVSTRIYYLEAPPPDDPHLAIMERWLEQDSRRIQDCNTPPLTFKAVTEVIPEIVTVQALEQDSHPIQDCNTPPYNIYSENPGVLQITTLSPEEIIPPHKLPEVPLDPFAAFREGQRCHLWNPSAGKWYESEIKGVIGGINGLLKIQWLNGLGGDFMFGLDKLRAGWLAITEEGISNAFL